VPSKALLKVSKVAHAIRTAGQYGIGVGAPTVDMPRVREYVQNAVRDIYQYETPEVFAEEYNVEVVLGSARFLDAYTILVGDRRMQADKFVIATGARPTIPSIEGLNSIQYFTNETIFFTDQEFDRLLIMGAGPVGVEMAQAHARLGVQVTLMDDHPLPKDEPEAVDLIRSVLESDGVRFELNKVQKVAHDDADIVATLENGSEVRGDALLVAVGRTPNVDGLALENAGVAYGDEGIEVGKYLRTSAPHIYAVGDCTTGPKFTHYASYQGTIAARNALFPIVNVTGHNEFVPWVTFTDPEVAHVGMTEAQAREVQGDAVKVYHFSMKEGDRAVAENDTSGFIKIVYKGSSDVLGATIVAERAGEMLVEFSYLLEDKLSVRDVVDVMHTYPTYTEITRKAVANLMIDELLSGTSGKLIDIVTGFLY
jgi:pyruvate/2-oxoglutarate dehydrogenase complex dihydrolipoamide dehydrogenase (E3) component